ncbi:MAG: YeeE/YedE family protein [Myxococcaceae bacterium]|nr:YeeE/YedE family protein [Myxococcaceae bacterium]MCI0669928.1 YeeE/YedE family protein [Myxococcaceae bacterium]
MVHPFVASLLGGALIGLSAALLLLLNGRIAGISGIAGGLFFPARGEAGWRLAFVGGLVAGGVLLAAFAPGVFGRGAVVSPALLVVAGLLVGFGTRLGNGCTSGHGVCGLARGSTRSLVATLTFMAAGALTVFVVRHVLGGVQ